MCRGAGENVISPHPTSLVCEILLRILDAVGSPRLHHLPPFACFLLCMVCMVECRRHDQSALGMSFSRAKGMPHFSFYILLYSPGNNQSIKATVADYLY